MAFTDDRSGTKLPAEDGPWQFQRSVDPDADGWTGAVDRSAVNAGLALNPSFSVLRARVNWTAMSDDPVHPEQLAPIFEGLRMAGLPEQ